MLTQNTFSILGKKTSYMRKLVLHAGISCKWGLNKLTD